jgi:hypothetical protein
MLVINAWDMANGNRWVSSSVVHEPSSFGSLPPPALVSVTGGTAVCKGCSVGLRLLVIDSKQQNDYCKGSCEPRRRGKNAANLDPGSWGHVHRSELLRFHTRLIGIGIDPDLIGCNGLGR